MLQHLLRLTSIFSILLLCGCLSSLKLGGTSSPAQSSRTVADNSGGTTLLGNWDGLIQSGLDFTYIRLELDKTNSVNGATEQSYSGMMYTQSFTDYLAKRSYKNDIQANSAPVNVTFNTTINTFSIHVEHTNKPGAHRGNRNTFQFRELSGIYSQSDRALAGLTGPRGFASKPTSGVQYFLFTRPDNFDNVTDTLKEFSGNLIGKSGSLFSGFGAPSKKDINKWVQKLYDEYPQMDLYHTGYGVLDLYCIKLMRDDHFEKHFGTRFDELGKRKLDGIHSVLRKDFGGSRDRQERSTGVMERMFWVGHGDNSAKQSQFWIKAHRFFVNWRKDQLDRLDKIALRKESLAHTDSFEAEMKKYAEIVFWPSEANADTQTLLATRNRIAYPALQHMLAQFQSAPTNLQLMNDLALWQKNEQRLFDYLNAQQKEELLKAKDVKLDAVIAELITPTHQKLGQLGEGLAAIASGNQWYKQFRTDFNLVWNHSNIEQTLRTFEQRRAQDLQSAEPQMLTQLALEYQNQPLDMSSNSDRIHLNYCGALKKLQADWFAVPTDSTNPSVRNVVQTMESYGGNITALLPPRMYAGTGFTPRFATDTDKKYADYYRSHVDSLIAGTGTLAKYDLLVKKVLPTPIKNAGFQFRSNIVWAIFHGRFDELDPAYQQNSGLGSQIQSSALNVNPQFHFAFISFVGLSSQKNREKQIGISTDVWWNTTITDSHGNQRPGRQKWGQVTIPLALKPYYENSYELAKRASTADGIFGNNPFGLFQTMAELMTKGLLSKSGIGADGEFKLIQTQWEKDIMQDLGNLLQEWPAQSYGLWQFQENTIRFLDRRQSVQSLYDYK